MSTIRITVEEERIEAIRSRYPDGLHFVVGDVHGETKTLQVLMEKILFDLRRDHVFFVGDYNEGGNPHELLEYMGEYYQADCSVPGFHMIRGNHERELYPVYPLENLPDIIVLRGRTMNYYIVHAGMVDRGFRLINEDMAKEPEKKVFAYHLDDSCAGCNAPLRQMVWSKEGLYSQRSHLRVWPDIYDLYEHHACIIHGHTPYSFLLNDQSSYGDMNAFWTKQHIWFSEDLCSFNIDANIKGRDANGETCRGIACLCLEVLDQIAADNYGQLTIEDIQNGENGVFSAARIASGWSASRDNTTEGNIRRILEAAPEMRTITLNPEGVPVIL